MRKRAVGLAVAVLALAGRHLPAQVPPDERIPVTDPDRLEEMGFPRDAANVAVWSRADLRGGRLLDEKAAETWGTSTGYTTVAGLALQAERPEFHTIIRDVWRVRCMDNASPNDEVEARAIVQLPVPEGVRLGQFQFWAFDSDPDLDLTFDVYETCQAPGAHTPAPTLLAHAFTILAIGNYFGFASLNDLTADARNCAYSVRVVFAPSGEECVAGGLEVTKLRVSWARQVSPAPATASFNDVPTDHPFFQFIEALAKSGITGGCNAAPPLYCPDAPLTRGQMAVFLAKGLGLQWP